MNDWKEANATNDATWDPDKEKIVQGKYVASKSGVGPNKSMVYTLTNPLGVKVGVWGSTVLDSKFEEIPVGSEVKIEFLGMATGKSGKEYKDFKVLYKDAPMKEAGADDSDEPIPEPAGEVDPEDLGF